MSDEHKRDGDDEPAGAVAASQIAPDLTADALPGPPADTVVADAPVADTSDAGVESVIADPPVADKSPTFGVSTPVEVKDADDAGSGPAEVVDERPEILVGAAFAGGFLLATILKRLG